MIRPILFLIGILCSGVMYAQSPFVKVRDSHFILEKKLYNYIGTNYWYGGLVANNAEGKNRIKKELDFLKNKGVVNLRILGGAEGTGQINGNQRVGPALQVSAGIFNEDNLRGLDFLLAEMAKRKMKAVIFLSNNWEWSGGFLQYLNWNKRIEDSVLARRLSWDEMKDYISVFYTCDNCLKQYWKQVSLIVNRKNSVTGKLYKDEPAIMTWEIANEPRPMRPHAIDAYKLFIRETARLIKSFDKNHLVTTGSEGDIGSETMQVFTQVHADDNIDYTTIHIWPKNWSWFSDTSITAGFDSVISKTNAFINRHITVAAQLKKPLVVEEFGLPRDAHSFSTASSTSARDRYYQFIFDQLLQSVQAKGVIAGANFWAFGGKGRAAAGRVHWKQGDDLLGDPPMEEQGLNSVFDTDKTTWAVIKKYSSLIKLASNKIKK